MYGKNKAVECSCPRCGTRHKMNIRWVGRGLPRKYCRSCRSGVASIANPRVYGLPDTWMSNRK